MIVDKLIKPISQKSVFKVIAISVVITYLYFHSLLQYLLVRLEKVVQTTLAIHAGLVIHLPSFQKTPNLQQRK